MIPLKENHIPLKENLIMLKENLIPLKENRIPLKENRVPLKENLIPLKENHTKHVFRSVPSMPLPEKWVQNGVIFTAFSSSFWGWAGGGAAGGRGRRRTPAAIVLGIHENQMSGKCPANVRRTPNVRRTGRPDVQLPQVGQMYIPLKENRIPLKENRRREAALLYSCPYKKGILGFY